MGARIAIVVVGSIGLLGVTTFGTSGNVSNCLGVMGAGDRIAIVVVGSIGLLGVTTFGTSGNVSRGVGDRIAIVVVGSIGLLGVTTFGTSGNVCTVLIWVEDKLEELEGIFTFGWGDRLISTELIELIVLDFVGVGVGITGLGIASLFEIGDRNAIGVGVSIGLIGLTATSPSPSKAILPPIFLRSSSLPIAV